MNGSKQPIAILAIWRRGIARSLPAVAVLAGCACLATASAARADSDQPVHSTRDALSDASSIIEGRVADIRFTYDPVTGPRTIATLTDVETHAGEVVGREVQIATLGGPLPSGRTLLIPELPQFRRGSRYVVFLTASDWFYSPVIADYAFRVETIAGRDLVVTTSGNPVVAVSPSGIASSSRSVDPDGLEFRTRFDPPVLVSDAPSRVDGAMTRTTFVTLVKTLCRIYPPRGTFRRDITPSKAWNVTTADRDSTSTSSKGQQP
jgi:hypothetical protein